MRRKIGLAHRQFWAGECSCAWGRRQTKKYVVRNEVSRPAKPDSLSGVVKLSLIDWNLPTAADFYAWYCIGLVCRSIVHIGRISLNVTMPSGHLFVYSLGQGWQISSSTRTSRLKHYARLDRVLATALMT